MAVGIISVGFHLKWLKNCVVVFFQMIKTVREHIPMKCPDDRVSRYQESPLHLEAAQPLPGWRLPGPAHTDTLPPPTDALLRRVPGWELCAATLVWTQLEDWIPCAYSERTVF